MANRREDNCVNSESEYSEDDIVEYVHNLEKSLLVQQKKDKETYLQFQACQLRERAGGQPESIGFGGSRPNPITGPRGSGQPTTSAYCQIFDEIGTEAIFFNFENRSARPSGWQQIQQGNTL